MYKIGVLAMQGAFAKHCDAIVSTGNKAVLVKESKDLHDLAGLIIPGGESTTIGKLIFKSNLGEALKNKIQKGLPVFGTCAGMILLAKNIEDNNQPGLFCMDITVKRNAYGRQKESFEADINLPEFKGVPFKGIFIRAPLVTKTGSSVETLASFEDNPILIKQDNMLAASFHPELTHDTRIHKYFMNMIREQ